jgi:hypothetical protein
MVQLDTSSVESVSHAKSGTNSRPAPNSLRELSNNAGILGSDHEERPCVSILVLVESDAFSRCCNDR